MNASPGPEKEERNAKFVLVRSLRWSSAPAEQPELWENSIADTKIVALAEQAHSASLTRLFYLGTAIFSLFPFLLIPHPTVGAQLLARVSPPQPDSSVMAGERS